MFAWIEITRPSVWILSGFAVLVGALLGGVAPPFSLPFFAAVAAVMLITAGGNTLNDYYDKEIDKVNKPERPIPSGRVSDVGARLFGFALIILGIILAAFTNVYMLAFAVVNSALLIAYNAKIKRTVTGHPVDSWLAASSFLFGSLLTNSITPTVWIIFAISFLSNLARETVKGIEDIAGDKKARIRTLAILLGEYAPHTAAALIIVSLIIAPIPYLLGALGVYYIVLLVPVFILNLYSLALSFSDPAKAQKLMKIGMFVGIFAFLAGLIK
ncbi:MAG: UbiA family prenyltransferase [Candidatus Aenigmarchaeota archaeon]|nr:UbiA family prenyltransferase [Candidatus Aenigmarchaeota archaeon]